MKKDPVELGNETYKDKDTMGWLPGEAMNA